MRPTSFLLALTACFTSTTQGLAIKETQGGTEPRVFNLPFHANHISDPVANDRLRQARRDGSVEVTVDNLQTLYYFNASLGTPEQEVRLHLDTGSSDLWVNTPKSTLCSGNGNPCAEAGTYSANDSSTYDYVGSWFNISYIDGSGAVGDYVTDTFHLGDFDIEDFQFGVGYQSTSPQSILGIGYPANEVQVRRAGKSQYQNLPARMVSKGMIASNAYSLFLNDLSASSGSILFGGVDRSQYQGELITVPIQKSGGVYREFFITLTSLSVGSTLLRDDLSLAVLLDTGSSLTWLPNDIVQDIYEMVNAVYDEKQGVAFVPCALGDQGANITFRFSEPAQIAVPLDELLLDFRDITGHRMTFADGVPACMFGIVPSGASTNVLGATFLRSAYVVFDLDNHEISLAQSKFNVSRADIAEIGRGANAVPQTTNSKAIAATSGLPGSGSGFGLSALRMGSMGVFSLAMVVGLAGSLI